MSSTAQTEPMPSSAPAKHSLDNEAFEPSAKRMRSAGALESSAVDATNSLILMLVRNGRISKSSVLKFLQQSFSKFQISNSTHPDDSVLSFCKIAKQRLESIIASINRIGHATLRPLDCVVDKQLMSALLFISRAVTESAILLAKSAQFVHSSPLSSTTCNSPSTSSASNSPSPRIEGIDNKLSSPPNSALPLPLPQLEPAVQAQTPADDALPSIREVLRQLGKAC
mmetsp:Transcript_70346/g.187448  ORF Transcript_70346/g.187448 Transcript_70346/m.187448 type:complete len:226 (-) Transcript_70346:162-839(-)